MSTASLGALLAVLVVPRAAAQSGPPIVLDGPTATAEVGFTDARFVRELADGRLIVADRGEQRLVLIDWRGVEELIGGRGDGPGEYRGVGALFTMPGDSTLFVDSYHYRWTVLAGADMAGIAPPDVLPQSIFKANVCGVDRNGRVCGYFRVAASSAPIEAATAPVALADRARSRLDTVARISAPPAPIVVLEPSGGGPRSVVAGTPWTTADQPLLFDDGWLAIVRAEPYRVDWMSPGGAWTNGDPIQQLRVRATKEEQCAALERASFPLGGPACDPSYIESWPAFVPPFVVRHGPVVMATPDGCVAIRRTPILGAAMPRYDFVGRNGGLVGTLVLEVHQRLVGFGRLSVYVAAQDAFDVQALTRHPWPPAATDMRQRCAEHGATGT